MEQLSRRKFIEKSLKVSVGVGFVFMGGMNLAGCSFIDQIEGNAKKPKHIVKIGLVDPEGHPHIAACKRFAEIVHKKTNNEVKVEIYPSSQLGDAGDMIQGLNQGTIEAFFGAVTFLGNHIKDFWLPGTLYLFKDQDHCRKIHNGPEFKELSEKIQKEAGVRVFTMGYDRGPRHLISKKPLQTLEGLKGLRIRVPAQKSWVKNFELAGAAPQAIAVSETFTGLQQGIVQATEQASNWLYFNQYHSIAKNITKSYHNYEQGGLFFSELIYKSYPDDVKKVLFETAKEVETYHNELMEKDIVTSEEAMKEAGVAFHDIELEKWQDYFHDIIPTLSKEIGYSKSLVDSILES